VLISAMVSLSLASRAIWAGWAVNSSTVSTVRLRTISPVASSSRRAHSVPIGSARVSGPKLFACVHAAVLAPQPFAVEQMRGPVSAQLVIELSLTLRARRPQPEARPTGRSGRPPVTFGAELDVQRAQVLPPEIVQRRELVLAAWVVQPADGQFAALSVNQPEEPPGSQGLGDIFGDCLAGPGLADRRRLGPVVTGDRVLDDDPAVRRGQRGEFRSANRGPHQSPARPAGSAPRRRGPDRDSLRFRSGHP
jgi:hypothetical protein